MLTDQSEEQPKKIRYTADSEAANVRCPKCNERMIVRNNRGAYFWGCSRYPKCVGTRVMTFSYAKQGAGDESKS